MKLYEQYLQELGLGKKIALGAAATLGGTIAYGIHKGKKIADKPVTGSELAKKLIGNASRESTEKADDVWMQKCRKYEFESKELAQCESQYYDPAMKRFYLQGLIRNRSKCGNDRECVQTINNEIVRYTKYIRTHK